MTVDDEDPLYTPDGRFYTAVVPAPYARAYYYRIVGDSDMSSAVSARSQGLTATPPSVPTHLTTAIEAGSDPIRVQLNWTPSNGAVTGYYVYRHWLHLTSCTVEDQAPWSLFGPVTTSSFVDSTPPTGSELYYRVRAVNSTGGSGPSAEAVIDLSEGPVEVRDAPTHSAGIVFLAPNPTRSSVDIAFEVPRSGRVELGAFDLAGRLVDRLVSGNLAAGVHRTRWTGVAPGRTANIYFLRLFLDGQPIGQRRVALLR